MREILFCGKRTDNGEWVKGSLIINYAGYFIISPNQDFTNLDGFVRVTPETISQFTGLYDKDGSKIFTGNIIRSEARIMRVIFKMGACAFWLVWVDNMGINRYEPLNATYGDDDGYFSNSSLEVIGNIYDNPELI